MGGSGSRSGTKHTVEGHKGLDVNELNRMGCLRPGRVFSVSWLRRDELSGSIGLRTEEGRVILVYRVQISGGAWEDVEEPVQLTWTPCNYGGRRPWFICPGVVAGRYCGRRVGKLYAGGKYFLCRHCYDLTYQTRREDRAGRFMLKAHNIQRRLGGEGGYAYGFPKKPKGMHWKTYQRWCDKYEDAALESWMPMLLRGVREGLLPLPDDEPPA
jgi:hypothetical protein